MIRTDNLRFSFKQGESLSFDNLEVHKNEHVLIIGKSGCGKTTLLHLLSGLRSPDEGKIFILDQEITSMKTTVLDKFRGRNIGMIFQVPHFVRSLSVLENLMLAQSLAGNKAEKQQCHELLEQLGIKDKFDQYPHQLSVGEQQRVAIARALINQPEIVFADEPTSALDDENTEQVIRLLKTQAEQHGATLIVVTHDQRLKDNFKRHIAL